MFDLLFRNKETKVKNENAKLLKTSPELLDKFEKTYAAKALNSDEIVYLSVL